MADRERHDTVPDLNNLAARIAEQVEAGEANGLPAPGRTPDYIGAPPVSSGGRPWRARAPDWVAGGLAGLGIGILVTFVIVAPSRGPGAADRVAAEAAAAEAAAAEAAAAEAAAAEAAAAAAALQPVPVKPTPKARPEAPKAASPPAPEPSPPAQPNPAKSSTLMLTAKGKSSAGAKIDAKVYIDDVYIGMAPVNSHAVFPGTRRVRFDCIFEGKTHRGKEKVIEIPPDTDAAIDHTCDVWVTLGR